MSMNQHVLGPEPPVLQIHLCIPPCDMRRSMTEGFLPGESVGQNVDLPLISSIIRSEILYHVYQ